MASATTTMKDRTVPSPKTFTSNSTEGQSRTRRLSLNIPNPPIRTPPLPVPSRQGSIHRSSFSINSPQDRRLGSSLSLSAGRGGWGAGSQEKFTDDEWLNTGLGVIGTEEGVVVDGGEGMEVAVEVLLASGGSCLLVDLGRGEYAFFDFSDLNVFLLLVLQAASSSPSLGPTGKGDRRGQIIKLLRTGSKVPISSVCNISEKNSCHLYNPGSTLRDLIPLLASGVHRVLLTTTPPTIITASNVLEHLITTPPKFFLQTFLSPSLDIPLNPLISLYAQGSILDAMQVMSLNNLSALGVLGEVTRHRRSSSSSSTSRHVRIGSSSFKPPSRTGSGVFTSPLITAYSPGVELESPFESGDLLNVITAEGCGRLVVPSHGREALGMGLGEATKKLQVIECAGQERGEERVPVHTITSNSTVLHASHLILATSSSRVFLRNPNIAQSPSLSPTIPSPPSPSISISSLSLSDPGLYPDREKEKEKEKDRSGLPIPPATVYSPHYVVSITDILGALGRAYRVEAGPMADSRIEGRVKETESKNREEHVLASEVTRAGDGDGTGGGLGSWKWAKEQGQPAGSALA